MNYLYIDVYTILYFSMNDLNALSRMLTVKFELRIDWYTNKGQIRSIANERNDVSLRSVALRDSIDSVHELIFKNQSTAQRDNIGTVHELIFKNQSTAQRDCTVL